MTLRCYGENIECRVTDKCQILMQVYFLISASYLALVLALKFF